MAKISFAWYALLTLLAIGLTLLSQNFVRPVDCRSLCDAPENTPCPAGACRFFEQRAGLPLPFQVDSPGGGSPTNSWGILGPEDLPDPLVFVLDVLFYGLVLRLAGYVIQARRGKAALKWVGIVLPLVLILSLLAAGYLLYRPVLGR